ncbi:MAG: hypothetical protein WCG03_06275 [Kiritimatiellales bacterium]
MGADITYKVGILGCPAKPDVEWTHENLSILRHLGFNMMQLNIAWGGRPRDEPLNLEDVVELPVDKQEALAQEVPLQSDLSSEKRARRKTELQQRIQLCRDAGIRTLFHFGAPYNGAYGYDGSSLPNCLLDAKTEQRYICLLEQFAKEFPGVDDLLVYTFDQNAWLCNEFGGCKNCRGIPLHERVVPFINRLAKKWHSLNPSGKLWWEPWELSAGQVLKSIGSLSSEGLGLALHSNIAEVMATLPVDRWLKNACSLAGRKGIDVIVEGWLGAASEELEPFISLAHPLVTLRQLRAIAAVDGVRGVKEYYGLLPGKDDPNLRTTELFFSRPDISDEEALANLSRPYGSVAARMVEFWELCSAGMELFPWETSWYIREIGKCNVRHSMSAAFIRGQQCATPSWESTRRAIFMKTDDSQPHPWMLEDVQLRCDLAARKMEEALSLGRHIQTEIGKEFADDFSNGLEELAGFARRAWSYVYHLRETNLATTMRLIRGEGSDVPGFLKGEMLDLLKADRENQQCREPLESAIRLFEQDIDSFLETYFTVINGFETSGGVCLSAADFSVTSRKERPCGQ